MLIAKPTGAPVGAGGAERREEVGEEAEEGDAADPAQDPVAAARGAPAGAATTAPTSDQRPERAEGLVQAGGEVVAPDAGVGRVVDDAEVRAGRPAGARGAGSEIGPRLLDLRHRVAGDDQVAQVPEAAAQRGPARTTTPPPPSAARPARGRSPRRLSAAAIASTVTFVPAASPTASPAAASAQPDARSRARLVPGRPAAPRPRPGRAAPPRPRPGSRSPASSSAAAIRSFFAAPGSRTTSVWHSSRIAAATTRRGARARRAARCTRRPGSATASQPEVEEQRERVAPRQQDPDRVQQLRVLRVEPVREDGVDVVHPGHRVALHHVRPRTACGTRASRS